MALDSKNNIKSVFIVPAVTPSPAAGTKITPGSTTLGWVGITNMSNEVLDTTSVTTYSKIKIIKDRGEDLPLQQVVLNLSDIVNTSAYSGAIATEQVSYIGYNGTTGSMAAFGDKFYEIKLEHVPNAFAYGKRPANYKYGTYKSAATTTQELIATGLVKSLIQNFVPNRSTDWRVFSSLVNSSVTTAAVDTDITNFTLTKYSKAVTVVTAGAAAITAGTYLRFGSSATTTSVYKVVTGFTTAIAGTFTIELDYGWQDNSKVLLDTDVFSVTVAANWGIKIQGIKQKYDVNRWRQYDKVRFNPFINDAFGATLVTTTAAFDGIGVYEQVANDEYISWGDEGQVFVDQVPPLFREQDAQAGVQYNPAVISWVNKLPSLIGAGENKGQVILYMAGGDGIGTFAPTLNQLTLVNVFNAWVPGTNLDLPGTFPDPTLP